MTFCSCRRVMLKEDEIHQKNGWIGDWRCQMSIMSSSGKCNISVNFLLLEWPIASDLSRLKVFLELRKTVQTRDQIDQVISILLNLFVGLRARSYGTCGIWQKWFRKSVVYCSLNGSLTSSKKRMPILHSRGLTTFDLFRLYFLLRNSCFLPLSLNFWCIRILKQYHCTSPVIKCRIYRIQRNAMN
jgi:hypothetical protein